MAATTHYGRNSDTDSDPGLDQESLSSDNGEAPQDRRSRRKGTAWRDCRRKCQCCLGSLLALALVVALILWLLPRGTAFPSMYREAPSGKMLPLSQNATPEEVAEWARSLVSNMTLEEKHILVNGAGWYAWSQQDGYYVGNILAITRLGIPSLRMQDAMQGFRTTDERMIGQVTAWPCALAVASSWSPKAVEDWAAALGNEFITKGANMVLGPSVNVHRVALNGRNAEYLSGEDPTLGKHLARSYVHGVQVRAGAGAVAKHFVLNQQETHRTSVNSVASQRVLWELYYPPFEAAVKAGVAAFMCSYNYVNGKQACDNEQTLTKDLKETMGFRGFVMSDWWALKDSSGAMAGTDQDQPGTDGYFSPEAVAELPQSRLDDMASRVLTGMAKIPAFAQPKANTTCRVGSNCEELLYTKNATSDAHRALARKLAAEGTVLLKNEGGLLPLASSEEAPLRVAVVGKACGEKGDPWSMNRVWTRSDYYSVGGSGRVLSPFVVSVQQGLTDSGLHLIFPKSEEMKDVRSTMLEADVAVVCGGATTAEASDRTSLSLEQEAFMVAVTALAKTLERPVITIALAPGAIVAPWRHNATAALVLFLGGQEAGHGVADIVLGRVNPSARLPVTFPAKASDAIAPCEGSAPCEYREGLKGGWHIYEDVPVAFPFGHGLSYTDFQYSVVLDWTPTGSLNEDNDSINDDNDEDAIWNFSVLVRNSGTHAGADILQLYLGMPRSNKELEEEPRLRLAAFAKTAILEPGQGETLTFGLTSRDMSYWSPSMGRWHRPRGRVFTVMLGASSHKCLMAGRFGPASAIGKVPMTAPTCSEPWMLNLYADPPAA
mmetsp:Transcript_47580/g.102555  ORF Transcript_47580/g.102555 Transcript_47580/m.102555 type:complete len:832 (-) Transcript_47580:8-2503(-)